MKISKFRYPVDTDQFQNIREQGKVYVDKTDMMFDLVSKYNYVFLARPRRFGKSLLCNTFKAYFKGQRELFEGLKVMDLEKSWEKYPVFHFILSGLKDCSIEDAKGKLELLISKYEKDFGRNETEKTPGARFSGLIHRADVVIKTKTDIFVLELKVDDTVETALAQIDDKGYAVPYEAVGRKVSKCGVRITSEKRNITHWRIIDTNGNLVDEQVF